MRAKLLIVGLVLAFAGCAEAQFIGYTAQQTVQQTLATNLLCTGSAQTFPVTNLGQAQHYLQIGNVTGAQSFTAEIDGVDTQNNTYRISDVLQVPGLGPLKQGTLRASGYFPKVQIVITCAPNTATFTASYSGAQTVFDTSTGSYLTAQIDKVNFTGVSATASQNDNNEQTPFGSAAGTLLFTYASTPTTPGTISVGCTTNGNPGIIFPFAFTLAATTVQQSWAVPDVACPFLSISYAPGTGGTTVTAEYVFAVPGVSTRSIGDPCSMRPKSNIVVSAAAASTTQILAAVAGFSYYVCGYQLSQAATAGTVQWVYGTGASCGTGTTSMMGAMPVTASQPFSYGTGGATVMKTGISNALCLTTTGAGGTVNGVVTIVQSS